MSYQVIARKWRPQTFDEVTGQEHITRTLRNAIAYGRLHHSYLFSGARGVGKTTTARLLAKAVNCRRAEGPTATPCSLADPDACVSCREIAEGRSMDVIEIDAASHTQVENVRDVIINSIGIAPARDRFKVFIIDEVHMLSGHSFNALLKTIEEPPPRVLFIMATTHAHKVPETILSRSQQFEFRTISAAKIAERLRLIADAEKIEVSDEALREVARAGEGSMRDAQSAFDQVISFSEGKIEASDVEAALGLAGRELLSGVMSAVAGNEPAKALAVVEDLVARGHDLRNFCRDLLAHVRDLLVFKVAGDGAGAGEAGEAERRELAAAARDFSESDLVRFFHSLTETERHLRESVHPRYQLEIGLVKLIEMRRLAPLGQLIERLNALEEALRKGQLPAGGPGAQTPPATPATGGPARRSSAGGGAASFSAAPPPAATPAADNVAAKPGVEPDARASAPPKDTLGQTPARAVRQDSARPAPPAPTAGPAHAQGVAAQTSSNGASQSAPSGAAQNFGAGRAATSAPPALKLVPPSPQKGSGALPDEAPFPLGEPPLREAPPFSFDDGPPPFFGEPEPPSFFDEVRAGEDAVGPPVALGTPHAASPRAGAAAEHAGGADDTTARIKRGLEGRGKPFLAVAVEGARRVVVEGDEVQIEFAPEGKHLRDTLSKPENMRLLREVCCEVLGRPVGVGFAVRVPGETDDLPLSRRDEEKLEQKRLREIAESHPLVQQVLKTFRGEIIDVRRVEE